MIRWGVVLACLWAGCGSEPERAVRAPGPPVATAAEAGAVSGAGAEAVAVGEEPRVLGEVVTVEARVSAPPHPVPDGAPHAVVHLPAELRLDRPLPLVVFLHGWNGCARVLASSGEVRCLERGSRRTGWGLIEEHAAGWPDAVFVVPQLAWLARTGRPGRFGSEGAFAAYVAELLRGPLAEPLGGPRSLDDVGDVTLVAHSAGYETAMALVEHGGVDIDHVVLFDALYDDGRRFARWVLEDGDRRLVALFATRGEPRHHTRLLVDFVRAEAGEQAAAIVPLEELPNALRTHRMVAAETTTPHGAIPRRHLAEILRALRSAP